MQMNVHNHTRIIAVIPPDFPLMVERGTDPFLNMFNRLKASVRKNLVFCQAETLRARSQNYQFHMKTH